jgi:DNA-binding XRE family transcriptional regulator
VNTPHMLLRNNIRRLKREKILSSEELAKSAGLGLQKLLNLENGVRPNTNMDMVEKLSRAFDVHPSELFKEVIDEAGN